MTAPTGVELEELMAAMREKIRRRKQSPAAPADPPAHPAGPSDTRDADLAQIHRAYDLAGAPLGSARRILSPAVNLARKLVRALVMPVLARQAEYNAANTRLVSILVEEVEALREQAAASLDVLSSQVQSLQEARQRAETLAAAQAQLKQGLAAQQSALLAAAERIEAASERIEALARELPQLHTEVADSSARTLQAMSERAAIRQNFAAQTAAFDAANARMDAIGEELSRARAEVAEAGERMLRAMTEQAERLSRRYTELGAELGAAQTRALQALAEEVEALGGAAPSDGPGLRTARGGPGRGFAAASSYVRFEQRFRGSEQQIRDRLRVYFPYFQGQDGVVDLGCGRGEFLQMLGEAGVAATGVDIDPEMVEACRAKGLAGAHGDLLDYLEGLADGSLGGIFSAQVAEHLPAERVARLVTVAHRKLRPEASLVVETLNPESLFVLYRWFWMDPTHVRLIHPETLKFLFESAGFRDVTIRFAPAPEGPLPIPALELDGCAPEAVRRFNLATDYLNKLLYGSQDYAVAGRKD